MSELEPRPSISTAGLKKVRAWEHALRFVFGGVITVATGLIAKRFGPLVGGLFLAFPAILPAALEMIKAHEGRTAVAAAARGSAIGALGLAGFGATVWFAGPVMTAPWFLGLACAVWLAISVGAWWLIHRTFAEPV